MAGSFGPGLQLFPSTQPLPGTAWLHGDREEGAQLCLPLTLRPPPAANSPLSTHRQVSEAQTHILLQQPAYLVKAAAHVVKL